MRGDLWNVFRMLLERRSIYCHDIDPVVKILPESAVRYHLLEILVSGKYQTRTQGDEPITTQPAEFTLLKDPQELYLRGEAEFTYFIEE
jgi:hypothetical protein